MIWGPSGHPGPQVNESWVTAVPKLGFVVVLMLLGVYTPAPVSALLLQVAQSIGGP
jgi:hydrogenase-4 component F